jgi:UDP-N-acetylglucosamine 2-epimerase
MSKISFIVGTRPELIKMAPVILELQARKSINFDIVNTGQHQDLLDPYWSTFNLEPTHVLDVMRPSQNLSSLTSRAILEIQSYLDNEKVKPSVIMAQGDTTTVMAASLVSFYNKIKFVHLEAGLRSFDFENPFPEEFNRRVAAIAAVMHFCPTEIAVQNLLNEGIEKDKLLEVGNTVIDALNYINTSNALSSTNYFNSELSKIEDYDKTVLVTCHRRENQGENLKQIIKAIGRLADDNGDIIFTWAIHPNPNVKNIVLSSELKDKANVLLLPPLQYLDLIKIMEKAVCIISDSGGIQEEAPSFKAPVIVLREKTERPEGVNQGIAFLVGASYDKIIQKFQEVINHEFSFEEGNPYGDGLASKRVVDTLLALA